MEKIKSVIAKINVYNLMIFILILFSLFGIYKFGYKSTLLQLFIAVIVSCLLDSLFNYFKYKNFKVSKSGIITGFFIALVLTDGQPWYIPFIASVIAIFSKWVIRLIFKRNLFNPAMFGIFISMLIFKTSDGWWGAYNLILVLLLGLFLVYKFKRVYLVLTFLLVYFLMTILIHGFYYSIFLNSTLYFFVFFILTEPRTSPVSSKAKFVYGVISAIIVVLTTLFIPDYSLTAGLLLSNIFVPLLNKIKSWY